jgi:hypothetical protein
MEIFIDFGLFELIAAVGLSALANKVYTHALWRIVVPVLSVVAPVAMILMASTEALRWLGALCLATTLINLCVVIAVLQRGEVPKITLAQHRPAKKALGAP